MFHISIGRSFMSSPMASKSSRGLFNSRGENLSGRSVESCWEDECSERCMSLGISRLICMHFTPSRHECRWFTLAIVDWCVPGGSTMNRVMSGR